MTPVFILSMPRSGSTMLQKILCCDELVKSDSEQWFLLPLLYTLKDDGVYSEYAHFGVRIAINDIIKNIGKDVYFNAIEKFSTSLYKSQVGECKYFIDKTPRYSLVADELIQVFPDAKFIVLVRDPRDVVSSINSTWGNGGFEHYKYNVDLALGMSKLTNFYNGNREKCILVSYESLVLDPNSVMENVFNYLDLDFKDEYLESFSKVSYAGSLGDPNSGKKYGSVSSTSVGGWKAWASSYQRKKILAKYIKGIGGGNLSSIGYSEEEMVAEINKIKVYKLFSFQDLLGGLKGFLYCHLEPKIFYKKLRFKRGWIHD